MLPDGPLPRPEKSHWLPSMLLPIAIGIALFVALSKCVQWQPAFAEPQRSELYRVENGEWRPLPELPGEPESVEVSSSGTVWVVFWRRQHGHEFARLDGEQWRIYGARDFGAPEIYVSGGFSADGEAIWAATDDGVLHFDGARWSLDETAGKDVDSPNEVLAANGHVWAVYDQSRVASFNGGKWTTHATGLPAPDPSSEDDAEYACTADGSLWIVNNNVWRNDGLVWKPVPFGGRSLENAVLAGSTADRLWITIGDQLAGIRSDGTVDEFSREQLGLGKREFVERVAQSGTGTYAAAGPHILTFEGAGWRLIASAPSAVRHVFSVAASGGQLFAIGSTPNPLGPKVALFIPAVTLLLCLGLLAIPVWMVRRYKRDQLRQHHALQRAVAHATGAVPDEFVRDERILARQSSWWSATVAVGEITGAWIGFSIARMFWPGIPSWTFLAMALALHVIVTVSQTLVKRAARPWDPIEPGGPAFDWGPTRRALPGSLVVFLLLNLGKFPKWMGSPVSWILYAGLALMWYKLIEQKLMVNAINRAEYEGALKIVRRFRFYNLESGEVLMHTGHILVLAGKFHEAEQTLRCAAARLRNRAAQARTLEFLGNALIEQGRYDEAVRAYDAALHAKPGFCRPYRGLAESVLRRDQDPARALEYIEKIVGPSGPSRRNSALNNQANDDYWALKAWALARLGRSAESDAAAKEAIRTTNPNSRPDLAATNRRLTLAKQALGPVSGPAMSASS